MTIYLLDTDVCIHAMKKRNKALNDRIIEQVSDMAVSDVSLFELLAGAQYYPDSNARAAEIGQFTGRLLLEPFDTRAARHAADIRIALKSEMIGVYDVQIAGIARSRGMVLVTGNTREFKRVEGLRTENWLR